MVAVPVGPVGLLCVNRTLSKGPTYGLFSGLGIATADALSAGVVALGLTLVSGFLIDQQVWLRLIGGTFLLYIGIKISSLTPPSVPGLHNKEATCCAATLRRSSDLNKPRTPFRSSHLRGWGVEDIPALYGGRRCSMPGVFFGSRRLVGGAEQRNAGGGRCSAIAGSAGWHRVSGGS